MTSGTETALRVIDLITGGWRAQALYTAVKLGVPDAIESGRTTSAALAEGAGADWDGVHRLMRFLVSLGLFQGDERSGYRNTELSRAFCEGPSSLKDMCLLYGEEFYTAWGHAYSAISTATSGFEAAFGESFYSYLSRNEDVAERFQNVMNAGNIFFHKVPEVVDFSGDKTVVDVGGGGGELLAVILATVPDARGTLFDRPHMIPEARRHIAGSVGLSRVDFVAGDMFEGLPRGGDIYLFSRVFAGWDDDAIVKTLSHCYTGMKDRSSRLVILDRLVSDEDCSPMSALWDLHLLITIGGRHRSLENFTSVLGRAGFEVECTAELPSDTTAIVARKCNPDS
ncbi:hypothetical protein H6G14_29885 [Nostoc parmelioides FACHB-3921]|uniref:Methyltransferase n=1 Tax=Nostoc parmelioides FACHB-3921 TaxID=2692909 RepID=A0ABR8BP67_9NOSO|nr:methyltransferase [Nostoc parmelioides]MBD2255424.1 hypothetical protein [Nostoc parmelioides FACHB-3921]